jgi:nucleolar pre-ribosomal-associated protein 1
MFVLGFYHFDITPFSNSVIQIIKLYDQVASEGTEPHNIPADLVHHFLLTLCTRPGKGICSKDRGWYPRVSEIDDLAVQDEQESKSSRGGKVHNKILANISKRLKVNEDPRQQDLALKIMAACPELVAG